MYKKRTSGRPPASTCVSIATLAVALAGCGGGGSSGSSAGAGDIGGSGAATVQQLSGFFRAGNISGLKFSSGRFSGVTSAAGAYDCEVGTAVSFAVGSLELGAAPCATVAHAVALGLTGQVDDIVALNIERLLRVLDTDADLANGIAISGPLQTIAENWAPVDFSAEDFFAELTTIVSDIASVENRVVDELPDLASTQAVLEAGITCAFSGVYYNVYQSGTLGAPRTTTLNVYSDPLTRASIVDFILLRQDLERGVTAIGTADLELAAVPTADGTVFDATFVNPELVTGNWVALAAQQSFDRAGSYYGIRLGPKDGTYRFTGKIESSSSNASDVIVSRIEMTLESGVLSGQVFDNFLGQRSDVTGTVAAGSNDFEINIEGLGPATGIIIRDMAGVPIGLEGNWPGYEENVLTAAGCELI